jgi:hypothetical protein
VDAILVGLEKTAGLIDRCTVYDILSLFLRLLTFNLKLNGFAIAMRKKESVKLMKKHKRLREGFGGADW